MLKIRLTRRGKKNKAFFRLVVAEHTSPIKGKFIEALGFLNPHTKENSLKSERVKFWMEKGAQCSDSAHNMLVKAGMLKGPKRAVKMKKKEEVKEEIKTEEKTVPEKKEEKAEEKAVSEKEKKETANGENK
ncbi:MAG: 30S ribosomal protein S16 [Candidatus Moranbacteria bacterium]|nr:30S ribosomal protein S16 [Candidatus Moranbacteria bacterium]